jgi:pimeloyl-ACP methyl ester carboxylesterase
VLSHQPYITHYIHTEQLLSTDMNHRVPISFLYGTNDWMNPAHAVKLMPKLPHADNRLCVVDEAGHQLYLDNPAGFHEALKKAVA